MLLANVIGSIVSTLKHPAYNQTKLMVVQPIRSDGRPDGASMLAVDSVGSGPGETVLVLRQGAAAAQVLGIDFPPIRSVIVGIVDRIDLTPD